MENDVNIINRKPHPRKKEVPDCADSRVIDKEYFNGLEKLAIQPLNIFLIRFLRNFSAA